MAYAEVSVYVRRKNGTNPYERGRAQRKARERSKPKPREVRASMNAQAPLTCTYPGSVCTEPPTAGWPYCARHHGEVVATADYFRGYGRGMGREEAADA